MQSEQRPAEQRYLKPMRDTAAADGDGNGEMHLMKMTNGSPQDWQSQRGRNRLVKPIAEPMG